MVRGVSGVVVDDAEVGQLSPGGKPVGPRVLHVGGGGVAWSPRRAGPWKRGGGGRRVVVAEGKWIPGRLASPHGLGEVISSPSVLFWRHETGKGSYS